MIQGGAPNTRNADPRDDGNGGGDHALEDEFTDLPHLRGTVSLANRGSRNSGGTQFFIVHGDAPHLDGAHGLRTRDRGDGGGRRDHPARDRQVRPLRPARPPLPGLRGDRIDPDRAAAAGAALAERQLTVPDTSG